MDSLITQVIAWPPLLISLAVFGFAPGAALRMVVLAFRRGDPRRTELLAELPHVPRIERPFWVFEQLEVALFEGLGGRLTRLMRSRRYDAHPPISEAAKPLPSAREPSMRGYVGVTDTEWYRFLAERPRVSEAMVNFWRPDGSHKFRALEHGEPFFFKTHEPLNRIVGGGFFSGFAALPASEAWAMYGEANGVASLEQMRERIAHYRREPIEQHEDPIIACVFVRDVNFFSDAATYAPPPRFAPNITQGKSYDLANEEASRYFGNLLQLMLGRPIEIDFNGPWRANGPAIDDPRLTLHRLAQQAFSAVVFSAYHGECAITGTKIRPVLRVTNIRPISSGGENRLDNGLLLRSDVCILFEKGYLALDPEHRLLVSPRLRTDFGDGDQFYAKVGRVITLPDRRADRPSLEFLEWHLNNVYKTS